jgi:hypothetical protein
MVTPGYMIPAIDIQVGKTLDCIIKLVGKELHADQLVWVEDPHAESLRWLDITYRQTHPQVDMHLGYPIPKTDPQGLLDIIKSEARLEKKGVKLKDLSTVLQLAQDEVEEMMLDLQINGVIYQNEDGYYLPL